MEDVARAIVLAGRLVFALSFAMAAWRHIVGGAEMTGYPCSVGFPATALAPWSAGSGSSTSPDRGFEPSMARHAAGTRAPMVVRTIHAMPSCSSVRLFITTATAPDLDNRGQIPRWR